MTEPLPEDLAKWVADFREDALIWRLSTYAGGVSALLGALAGAFMPFGHPLAVWLVTAFVLCTVSRLAIGSYVAKRGDVDD